MTARLTLLLLVSIYSLLASTGMAWIARKSRRRWPHKTADVTIALTLGVTTLVSGPAYMYFGWVPGLGALLMSMVGMGIGMLLPRQP